MYSKFSYRGAGARRCFIACAALAALAPVSSLQLRAEVAVDPVAESPVVLDPIVVSATRTPQDARSVPNSVTVLSLSELEAAQITDLRTALAGVPGVSVANSGPAGAFSEVRIRGGNTHQTLFVVDGVRLNDRTAIYSNFLGGADLAGLDRVEVLRGPQSTLYGSAGIGGVVVLETARAGEAPFGGSVSAGGGTFDTFFGAASVAGSQGKTSYTASFNRFTTDNDLPGNGFDSWGYTTRVEQALGEAVVVGLTLRGQVADYEETGGLIFPGPGRNKNLSHLVTVYADVALSDTLRSRLTYGWHQSENDWTDLSGMPWAADLKTVYTRSILDWQNTWQATSWLELVGGANHEDANYRLDPTPRGEEVLAGYLSALARPVEHVSLTAGVRHDDFKSVGGHTTGRAGAAWFLPATGTTLRASCGTGFAAPSMSDRYGGAWQPANPAIKPEKSRGWDAGFEQSLLRDRVGFGATYFHNDFRDMFGYDPITFMTTNTEKASARGVETFLRARLAEGVGARVSYTYLETEDELTGARLARRPRHTLDAEISVRPSDAWLLGVGGRFVADRVDGGVRMEDYATMRVFAAYEIRGGLFLKARVENVADKSYEEVNGYPALPVAAYGSVEWRF